MLRGVVRSRIALHLEVLALRHQLQVLQRSRPRRLHLAKADRLREVRTLIRQIAHENPLWGALRIHGDLLKFDLQISQATVAK